MFDFGLLWGFDIPFGVISPALSAIDSVSTLRFRLESLNLQAARKEKSEYPKSR